jgi:hypothetical protein
MVPKTGTRRIWGFDIEYVQQRTKTHRGYKCWFLKMCGRCRNGDESPRWRKMIQIFMLILQFAYMHVQPRGEKLEGLNTDGWVPFLSMEQAMIGAVITGYSDETWHVRKQLDLVKPHREWSCSFRQQSLFADSCCKMLIKRKEDVIAEDSPLVHQARQLERLGLIAVEPDFADKKKWAVRDGDFVLLVNHLLRLSGHTKYCKLSVEVFLVLSFFFVMGSDALRKRVEDCHGKTIHAVCFYGKISMTYLPHLQRFFQTCKENATAAVPLFVESLKSWAAAKARASESAMED